MGCRVRDSGFKVYVWCKVDCTADKARMKCISSCETYLGFISGSIGSLHKFGACRIERLLRVHIQLCVGALYASLGLDLVPVSLQRLELHPRGALAAVEGCWWVTSATVRVSGKPTGQQPSTEESYIHP